MNSDLIMIIFLWDNLSTHFLISLKITDVNNEEYFNKITGNK